MRIAVIIDGWQPIVGGGQKQIWEISQRLINKYNLNIDIFTRALQDNYGNAYVSNESFYNGRLRIIRVGPIGQFFNNYTRLATVFTLAKKVISEHKTAHYDLIHAHVYLGAMAGKITQWFTKIPLILTVHGTNLTDENRKGLSAWLEKQICFSWRYNHIIAVGKGYLQYKNVNQKISIIPNGVNIEEFDRVPAKKTAGFKTIFVGRLEWTKGLDILIKAVSILRKKNPSLLKQKNFTLHLIGYGYEEKKLKSMTKENNLNNIIKFRGQMTGTQLVEEYKSSNLFILPSLTEGDSVTVKEAWAARLPVLVTRSNGPEYYIDDNRDGFLIDKKSPAILAEKISQIIQMPQIRLTSMAEAGYKKVVHQYTWNAATHKIYEVYSSVLTDR